MPKLLYDTENLNPNLDYKNHQQNISKNETSQRFTLNSTSEETKIVTFTSTHG